MTEQPQELALVWPDVDDVPVMACNQALTQVSGGSAGGGPDGILVTVGNVAPPVLLGDQEENEAMVAAIGALSVKALGRYQMSRSVAMGLITALNTAVQQYDHIVTQSDQGQGGEP